MMRVYKSQYRLLAGFLVLFALCALFGALYLSAKQSTEQALHENPPSIKNIGGGVRYSPDTVGGEREETHRTSGEIKQVSTVHKGSLPIFMYHDVKPDGEKLSGLAVSESKLREDFAWLRENGYSFILPQDLVNADTLPEQSVMMTFDDGYLSSYLFLYPILQEFQVKALISPVVITAEAATENFCNWKMYREMEDSGLVEIGSHSYDLHNPWSKGEFIQGKANGVQRRPEESEIDFQCRVLNDIQKSYDRITEELGHPPVCFAYPYGADESDTWDLVDGLFPVSLLTLEGHADLSMGTTRLPRWTVTEETPISAFLEEGPS